MADPNTAITDEHFTVDAMAQFTGRHPVLIRRWIRDGTLRSIQDPSDGRMRLIPSDQIEVILRRPEHGRRLRRVILTLADGTQITRVVAVPPKAGRPLRKEAL